MSVQETGAGTVHPTEQRVVAALDGLEATIAVGGDGIVRVDLERNRLHEALMGLRERAGFEMVTLVTAVDHLAASTAEPRFEVIHQLYSVAHRDRARTSVRLTSDDPSLPSVTDLWPGASFMEREVFDMFGIRFDGHPNLKRLLMPEGYGHHPLRKDFPHQGIEPDRLYREWDRERRKTWNPSEG